MTLDSSKSSSIADEKRASSSFYSKYHFLKGKGNTAPDQASGAEKKFLPTPKAQEEKIILHGSTSWCYFFVHNRKVDWAEKQLQHDHRQYFIHKTIKYVQRPAGKHGVRKVSVPTVSGLVFLQGNVKEIQAYVNSSFPFYHLCKDCSTQRVAVISNAQMQPFMRVAELDPDRIRFLLRPFLYYAKNHTLLRITSGPMAGLEGYVVRIARDRRLVMDVGGMSIALSGIHNEHFEEVERTDTKSATAVATRQLSEAQTFIDHYFQPVKTEVDVEHQCESIKLLRQHVLDDLATDKITLADAYAALRFMLDEVDYYYGSQLNMSPDQFRPITQVAIEVLRTLQQLTASLSPLDVLHQRFETDHDELMAQQGYLFD